MQTEHIGELYWESDNDPATFAREPGKDALLFPGVPLHGKSPENSVVMGIIDSGVSSSHPQLAGYLKDTRDFGGDGPEDTLGHGTAVALVALYSQGHPHPPMALLSGKVTDPFGNIREEAVVEAIDWVAAQGAKIVNLSLGFRGSREKYTALCSAIARHPEILFVAAAGNYGPDVSVFPAACGCSNVLSVGATDAHGNRADYSGCGAVNAPGNVTLLEEWAYYFENAQALARSGRLQEARLEYERSIAARPNAESEFQLGLIDLNENKQAAAVNRFKEAIKLSPDLAQAHEMLGASLFISGDYQDAEKSLRDSLGLYPEDAASVSNRARARFNLGQTLACLGRSDEARIELEAVKALAPDYPRIDEVLHSLNP